MLQPLPKPRQRGRRQHAPAGQRAWEWPGLLPELLTHLGAGQAADPPGAVLLEAGRAAAVKYVNSLLLFCGVLCVASVWLQRFWRAAPFAAAELKRAASGHRFGGGEGRALLGVSAIGTDLMQIPGGESSRA